MAKLGKDHLVTMKMLKETGETTSAIARRLSVDESTIGYHLKRQEAGAADRRSKATLIESRGLADDVRAWWEAQVADLPSARSPNAEALHAWLRTERGYTGSTKSVRKYVRLHLERPPLRPFRRVETPPGAQAQADWSEHREVDVGDGAGPRTLYVFHLVLSHSRRRADIACLGCDQLWWHRAHLEAFRRLGGVPAVVRIDNLKTGVASGCGVWGEVNVSYRGFARSLGFHVDPCAVRSPRQKGKVERGVRTFRVGDVRRMAPLGLETLQGWLDQRAERHARERLCPVTGSNIEVAWQAERCLLRPLPDPCPEPFDVVVSRMVSRDCLIGFEGRQYGVPFAYALSEVEVRGCAGVVQIVDPAAARIIKTWPRGTAARLLIDQECYDGDPTERVAAPMPLGRVGRRLIELTDHAAPKRSIEIYAALADALGGR